MDGNLEAVFAAVAAIVGGILMANLARRPHGWLCITGLLTLMGAFGIGYWLSSGGSSWAIWALSCAFIGAGGEFVHRLMRLVVELDIRRAAEAESQGEGRRDDRQEQ